MYSSPCIVQVHSLILISILYFVGRNFHPSLVLSIIINISFVFYKKHINQICDKKFGVKLS